MLNQLIEICHNEFGINNIIDNNNRLVSSDDIPRLIAIVTTQRRIIRADCDNFEYIIEVYRHDEDMTTISIDGTVFTKLNASWLVNTFGASLAVPNGVFKHLKLS